MNIISTWRRRGSPYTHFAHSIPNRPRTHVVEFFAIGTAVEEISKDHVIEPPTLVLPLID